MKYRLLLFSFVLGLAVALLTAGKARATTIIPVSDEDLVASSALIVEGRCVRLEPMWNEDHTAIYTYVTFRVRTVIKGDLQPGEVTLKQLGGQTSDSATIIWGAPYWQQGWDMMLFLNPDPEGALRVAHLSLGYFRLVRDSRTGKMTVSRSEPGENVDVLGKQPFARYEPYDDFRARIDAYVQAQSVQHAAFRPVPVEYPALARANPGSSNFEFLAPGFKWFEPESGSKVRFKVNPEMAPTESMGRDEAAAAAMAWSIVPGSNLRVEIAGDTTACGLRADGVSAISFNDCTGRFDPPVNCTGVVAVGGVAQGNPGQTVTIGGRTFARIMDGDVIFNTGFDCLLSDSTACSEILTHEMGHALGFGHSSESRGEPNQLLRDATMFFTAHLDGRGATLKSDDMDAARFLYRAATNGTRLAITTAALPDATVGSPYGFDIVATGTGPFTWDVSDGSLPGGLALSGSGRISGTCERAQAQMFTVRVRDGANEVLTRSLELRAAVVPAPFVSAVKFKTANGKLVVTALNIDATAMIMVNGVTIPPAFPVKFKAAKGTLVVEGSAADLNVRAIGGNSVVVVMGDQWSNAFSF